MVAPEPDATLKAAHIIIDLDIALSQDLSYKEKHWHEACFVCAKCRASLVDKQFGSKADRIYCGPCYDAQFATRCDGCGDVFRAGGFILKDLVNIRWSNRILQQNGTVMYAA